MLGGLLSEGIDPSGNRKSEKDSLIAKIANSFEVVAREWFAKHESHWSKSHSLRTIQRLERDIFPWICSRPIIDLTAPELLKVILRIEGRGAVETAHRALSNCGQIFRYAIATGRADRDPSQDLKGSISPAKGTHFSAITEPKQLGELLRILDGYKGTLVVRSALLLAPLVFVRPGELRAAKWADIDFEAAEWRFLITKTNTQHVVPLSKQAIAILKELQPLTYHSEFVFPSARSNKRPMSDNAILAGLRRVGITKDQMSGHGFRATARTLLDEVLGFRPDFIEHQLAHAVRDPNGRAYNRTAHLVDRKKMMQAWADYLDQLKTGAKIIPILKPHMWGS
jgi:integrase